MKKSIEKSSLPGLFTIVFVLVILLFSCTPSVIKIGFTSVLSGNLSQLGVKSRNAVQLAVEEQNRMGGINGIPIELIVKDNHNDPVTQSFVLQEFHEEGVQFVIGPLTSQMAEKSIEQSLKQNILIISPTISSDHISGRDDLFLRIISPSSHQAFSIAEHIQQSGAKTIGIVYDTDNLAYTEPLAIQFKSLFDSSYQLKSWTIAHKSHIDFLTLAESIKVADTDALFLIMSGTNAATLVQQLYKSPHNIGLYGSTWVKTGALISEGGKAVEDMILIVPYEDPVPNPRYQNLIETYEAKFGIPSDFVIKYSYEATQVLFKGLENADKLQPESVKSAILSIGEFPGMEDTIRIDRYGDADRDSILLQVKDGRFVHME